MRFSSYLTTRVVSFAFCLFFLSCNSDEPTEPVRGEPITITITDREIHLGDNEGSEGTVFTADIDIPASYNVAILSITFIYPNDAQQSGPEIDSPPDIFINAIRVGLEPSHFPDNPECISEYREYSCTLSIYLDIAGSIKMGKNAIQVIAKGAAHDGDDDFVFSNLTLELSNN